MLTGQDHIIRDLVPLLQLGSLAAGVAFLAPRAWRGQREARWTTFALGLAVLLASEGYLVDAGWLPFSLKSTVWSPDELAGLVFVLTVAWALARQFVSTRQDLQVALGDLQETFAATRRFVPYEFLELLGHEDLREVQRGDSVDVEVTVLFSDVRGFTSLSERLSARDTFQLVNDYLGHVVAPIQENRGFVDKFIGDAVMALFGGRVEDAVNAAIASRTALDEYNASRARSGDSPVRIGIGIHTGSLILGTLGSEDRLSCTVIGDTVNLASRIEGLCKIYGSRILLSEHTHRALERPGDFHWRELDRVRVKGKQTPVALFELLEGDDLDLREAKLATAVAFSRGLEHYRAGRFGQALSPFASCLESCPQDLAAALYIRRCELLVEQRPSDWEGVSHLDSK